MPTSISPLDIARLEAGPQPTDTYRVEKLGQRVVNEIMLRADQGRRDGHHDDAAYHAIITEGIKLDRKPDLRPINAVSIDGGSGMIWLDRRSYGMRYIRINTMRQLFRRLTNSILHDQGGEHSFRRLVGAWEAARGREDVYVETPVLDQHDAISAVFARVHLADGAVVDMDYKYNTGATHIPGETLAEALRRIDVEGPGREMVVFRLRRPGQEPVEVMAMEMPDTLTTRLDGQDGRRFADLLIKGVEKADGML